MTPPDLLRISHLLATGKKTKITEQDLEDMLTYIAYLQECLNASQSL